MAKRRTASHWAGLVETWKRSGRGGVEFAASAGVSAGQLRWWKWHLAKAAARTAPKSAMVRVEVRGSRPAVASVPIEITRDGWTVRVTNGVDSDTLGQVLDAIAIRPC
ncbi:hypothetical protein BH11MYX2_BH11MYX2_22410 [soil metagenome]